MLKSKLVNKKKKGQPIGYPIEKHEIKNEKY